MMRTRTIWGVVAMAALAVSLVACGGGGSGGTVADTTTPVISKGVMTKGSTIVNGVRFEDTAAHITADDQVKTAVFLDDGMVVKVKGKRNDDGVTGTAQEIEVENEVRGAVTSRSTDTFVVLGQTVFVTGATIFAGTATSYADIQVTDEVEVHGSRDNAGIILASRVEEFGADQADEVRGAISNLAGGSFDIGNLTLTYDVNTIISPASGILTEGALVEVHMNSGLYAIRIELEDLEDAEFEPAEGQELEVEGFVSLFTSLSATFKVGDRVVDASGSVRYEGGVEADLANDVLVEAEGHMTGGVLKVDKITFKDSVRIEAPADSNGSADALGLTVVVTSQTDLSILSTSIGGITQGDQLRIRGYKNLDGSVTATRIEDGSGGDPRLTGPVTDINSMAKTFKILGITISAGTAIARPNDDSGNDTQTMDLGAFFASLTTDRTIVKARGPYTSGSNSIAATEVELE